MWGGGGLEYVNLFLLTIQIENNFFWRGGGAEFGGGAGVSELFLL